REVSSVALDTGDQNNNLESNVSILVSFPLTILDKLQPSDDLYEHRLLKPLPFFENSEYRELAAIITRDIYVQNPHVKWSDIAGLSLSKRLVREAVVYPLKYPHLFTGILKPWSGILLYGPPGTGKTMLAKAVATECETTFFNISASSIVSKWRGDSEKLVRTLFELARYHAPSTIFIDELEAIMGHRTSDGAEHEGSRRMKTELLIQMDGLAKANKGHVFLLAASNLPWDLDVAMLRRLEKRILITVPDEPARRSIFLMHLPPNTTDRTSLLVSDTLDYDLFARMTASYSGSDILSVCKEAAMRPLRQIFERLESRAEGEDVVAGEVEGRPVTTEDVLEALRGTRPSVNAGVCKREIAAAMSARPANKDACYQWYFVTGMPGWESSTHPAMNTVPGDSTFLYARLWIVDPVSLTASEAAGTAASPSTMSGEITSSFQSVGQYPSISAAEAPKVAFGAAAYNPARYWELRYNSSDADAIAVTVSGCDVSLLNCFVQETISSLFVVQNEDFTATWKKASITTLQSSTKTSSAAFNVITNPCSENMAFAYGSLYGGANLVYSETFFTASGEQRMFTLPSGSSIVSVAATPSGVAALTSTGLYYFPSNSSAASSAVSLSQSVTSSLSYVTSPPYCDPVNGKSSFMNTHVVAWGSGPGALTFYFSADGGASFLSYSLTSTFGTRASTARILHVAIQHTFENYCILVSTSQDAGAVYLFDPVLQTLSKGNVFAVGSALALYGGAKSSAPVAIPVRSGGGDVLLGGDTLFYSPNGGKNVFAINLLNRNSTVPGLGVTESVSQLTSTSTGGLYAFLSSTNRIFFGISGLPDAYEILSGLTPTDRESASITAYVIPTSSYDNGISLTYSNFSVLSAITNTTTYEMADPVGPGTILATSVSASLYPLNPSIRGKTEIKVKPLVSSINCESIQQVSTVKIGCPSNRRIIYRYSGNPQPNATTPAPDAVVNCSSAPASFSLQPGTWVSDFTKWTTPSYELIQPFDCQRYGLPQSVYYGSTFTPVFDLYDGDTFIRTVEADVALWEENGRSSFTYVISNSQNYVPCYSAKTNNISPSVAGSPYTIFNTTNRNGIIWGSDLDGIFLFKAVVLDPNFSYCALTTEFAISVYGAPIPVWEQITIVLGLTGCVGILLGVSYLVYLRSRRKEAKEKEEIDEKEREEAENNEEEKQVLWSAVGKSKQE
ncbi:Katanin p60 ATPase-containing subunit A-like 2, partial [Irineochytrium annulatum]